MKSGDEELSFYYRSNTEWVDSDPDKELRGLPMEAPLSDRMTFDPQESTSYRSWYLDSYLNRVILTNAYHPILCCELMEKGDGTLYTKAPNLASKRKNCDTRLIKDGVVKNLGFSGPRTQRFYLNTYFVLPETCYNCYYQNPDLPTTVESSEGEVEVDYFMPLSPNQVPLSRYSSLYRPFLQNFIKDLNPMRAGNAKDPIPLCLFVSPYRGDSDLRKEPFREMELSRELMAVSSERTSRLSLFSPDTSKVKHVRKEDIDPNLLPRPVEQTEMGAYFKSLTSLSLGDYCGYGYDGEQIPFFSQATNHIIRGEVFGNVLFCLYLEGIKRPSREMFIDAPQVIYGTQETILPAIFISLYPPEDEEDWKRYSVIASYQSAQRNATDRDFMINIDQGLFLCGDDEHPEIFMEPYCTFPISYYFNYSNCTSSYVKYLPTKEGGWVDVTQEKARVYTRLLIFFTCLVDIVDGAARAEYLDKVRIMTGTPKLSENELSEFNTAKFCEYYSVISPDYTLRGLKLFDYEPKTSVFNDLAYLNNVSCTPTDYKVQRRIEERSPEEGRRAVKGSTDVIIHLGEAIHK